MRQRETNAIDTVAAAARAAARGESYDVGAIEHALIEARLSMSDFEAAVEVAGKRIAWLADFDKLANASNKMKKAEAAIAAEQGKFEDARRAFAQRAEALDTDLATARSQHNAGEQARHNLLDARNVPGTIGDRYRAAVAEAEAAAVEVGTFQREMREVAARIKSEEEWIAQLTGENIDKIRPYIALKAPEDPAESHRIEDKRKILARAQRRKAEVEASLKRAEVVAAKAQKAVDDLVPEVLKS
jgi:chromosome segregation ATPase